MNLQINRPLIFFDLETTGTSPNRDRIVQMHFIKVHPDGREEIFSSLVYPEMDIPSEASAIHGIYDADVAFEKSFNGHASTLYEFLSGCDLAGFNSDHFDIPLLVEEFNRAGYSFPEKDTRSIDVLLIERKVNSHKLTDTFKRYTGRDLDEAHDAGADIRATLEVLDHQLVQYPELGRSFEGLSRPVVDPNQVDRAGKLILINGVVCFNFGKHKGHPVKDHAEYVIWLLDNDFPDDTKLCLKEAVG